MDAVVGTSNKNREFKNDTFIALRIRAIHREFEDISVKMAADNVQEYQAIKRLSVGQWLSKFDRYCQGIAEQKRKNLKSK